MALADLIQDKPQTKSVVSEKTKNVTKVMRNVAPKRMMANMTKDSNSITGVKKTSASYRPIKQTSTPDISKQTDTLTETKTENASSILSNMLSVFLSAREDEIRMREKYRATREERRNEEQKNHERFVRILREYTGTKTAIVAPEEDKEFGLWNTIKSFVSDLFKPFSILLDVMPKIMGFFNSPLGLALMGVAGSVALAAWFSDWSKNIVKEKMPDYSKIGPEEAKAVLENGNRKDIERYGGESALLDIVSNGAANAQKILETGSEKEINAAGGRTQLEKWSKETGLKVTPPPPTPMFSVPPRPAETGLGARAKEWDRKFGTTHNTDGTPKTAQKVMSVAPSITNVPDVVEPVTVEPVQTPTTNIAENIQQNIDLQNDSTDTSSIAQPIVSTNVSGSTVDDKPISTQPKVRDSVPILEKVERSNGAQW